MTGALVVARRELTGLFKAPFTWVVMLVVLLLNGMWFNAFLVGTEGNVSDALAQSMAGGVFWSWMVILPALLAMRLVAEETRSGTLEYLLTAPVSDAAVITGKFLAATSFLALLWTSSLMYAVVLDQVGGNPDWQAVIGTWVGTVFVSALFVSIGLLASTFTATPLLAAFLSLIACVLWLFLPALAARALAYLVPLLTDGPGERSAFIDTAMGLVNNMDAMRHFQRSFRLGVIDTAEIVFFVTWTGLFLFLTTRSLEARRWRG